MRIISGKYKGRVLKGFDIDGTRPTMDRVKESLFAMIQNNVKNSICLDLFAGSGSLGLEALSNGASKCYFVDKNPIATTRIKENTMTLGLKEEVSIHKMDYEKALQFFKDQQIKFDIIFLDPPYQEKLIVASINKIKEYQLLKEDGIIICEYERENVEVEGFEVLKERRYGSKYIKIYK